MNLNILFRCKKRNWLEPRTPNTDYRITVQIKVKKKHSNIGKPLVKGEVSKSEIVWKHSRREWEDAKTHTATNYLMLLNWTIWKCCEKKMFIRALANQHVLHILHMHTLGIRYSRFKSWLVLKCVHHFLLFLFCFRLLFLFVACRSSNWFYAIFLNFHAY